MREALGADCFAQMRHRPCIAEKILKAHRFEFKAEAGIVEESGIGSEIRVPGLQTHSSGELSASFSGLKVTAQPDARHACFIAAIFLI